MQSRNIAQSGCAIGDPKSMSQYLPNVIIKKNDNNKNIHTHVKKISRRRSRIRAPVTLIFFFFGLIFFCFSIGIFIMQNMENTEF